jgi:hypothetical protein
MLVAEMCAGWKKTGIIRHADLKQITPRYINIKVNGNNLQRVFFQPTHISATNIE